MYKASLLSLCGIWRLTLFVSFDPRYVAAHPMLPNLGQGGCQATEDGFRFAEELATVTHTSQIESALQTYYRKRIPRTTIIQILAQLGADLLVDFDKMMTIPLVGPFFLYMTQFSMPWILRFLYTAEF